MFEKTLSALNAPIRREILNLLRHSKMSAGEIADHFDMTQATVSYHLSKLKEAGLIFEEKEKNFIYYQINTSIFEELLMYFQSFLKKGDDTHVQK